MTENSSNDAARSFADRRAEMDAPLDDEQPDIGGEHTASATDPANAEADATGGEAEGHLPPTDV